MTNTRANQKRITSGSAGTYATTGRGTKKATSKKKQTEKAKDNGVNGGNKNKRHKNDGTVTQQSEREGLPATCTTRNEARGGGEDDDRIISLDDGTANAQVTATNGKVLLLLQFC